MIEALRLLAERIQDVQDAQEAEDAEAGDPAGAGRR